jgi:hypothetical protein
MFSNVAAFSVTNRSISSTKKKIFFSNIFNPYLNDYLTTYILVTRNWFLNVATFSVSNGSISSTKKD